VDERLSRSLRGLLQAISEQLAIVSAALGRMYESAFVTTESAPGVYRGTVVDVVDPLQHGRVQVLVPDVRAEAVWAPVSRTVGALGVGEQVWVAYEAGQPDQPVVIGSS
jgi:hypothetical protein